MLAAYQRTSQMLVSFLTEQVKAKESMWMLAVVVFRVSY